MATSVCSERRDRSTFALAAAPADAKRPAIASRTAGSSPVPTPRCERDGHADDRGGHRRDEEVEQRLAADAAEPAHVAERRDADEQARDHERHDDHRDEPDEDRADRLDRRPRAVGRAPGTIARRAPAATPATRPIENSRVERHAAASVSRRRGRRPAPRASARRRPDGCRPCDRCETPSAGTCSRPAAVRMPRCFERVAHLTAAGARAAARSR